MARKWDLFFRRLQSLLSGIVMLLFCVTIQPLLLTGESVNAANPPIVANSSDDFLDRSQQLYQSGDYPAAIKSLEKSIEIYRSRGDNLRQAMRIGRMGWGESIDRG
jgi:hypothetical protein